MIKISGFNFIPIHDFVPNVQKNIFAETNQEGTYTFGDLSQFGPEKYIALSNGFYGDGYVNAQQQKEKEEANAFIGSQQGQQALDASRQTELARSYEPYQRLEFLKGIMTNMPTSQSAVTATTAPGTNPFAQAAGTGIGAYAAYNMANKKF